MGIGTFISRQGRKFKKNPLKETAKTLTGYNAVQGVSDKVLGEGTMDRQVDRLIDDPIGEGIKTVTGYNALKWGKDKIFGGDEGSDSLSPEQTAQKQLLESNVYGNQADWQKGREDWRSGLEAEKTDAQARLDATGDREVRDLYSTTEFDKGERYSGDVPLHLQSGAGKQAYDIMTDTLGTQGPSSELDLIQKQGDAALRRGAQNQLAQAAQQSLSAGQLGQGGSSANQSRAQMNIMQDIMANEAAKTQQTMSERDQMLDRALTESQFGTAAAEDQFRTDATLGQAEWQQEEANRAEARRGLESLAAAGDATAQNILTNSQLYGLSGQGISEQDKAMSDLFRLEEELTPANEYQKLATDQLIRDLSPEVQYGKDALMLEDYAGNPAITGATENAPANNVMNNILPTQDNEIASLWGDKNQFNSSMMRDIINRRRATVI